jgi:YYY domain-containing protein
LWLIVNVVTRDIFVWWLTAQAFGLAGLPLAQFLFRALPDRGYAFGKTLGLLLSGYLAWLLAMLGLAPFGRGLLVICMLAIGAIGLFVIKDQRPKPVLSAVEGTKDHNLTTRWQFTILNVQFSIPLVLAYESLFALALIFLALLRSYNPDPWGTERPMDYALFNAIRGSTAFPPHDPWLAGYSINYYYFGYLLMAAVSLVSGIAQGVAFNLSLALIFALTALGVAGVVVNLIGLREDRGRRTKDESPESASRSFVIRHSSFVGRAGAVLLAVVLVLFAGNQGGALEVVTGLTSPLPLDVRDLARAAQNGLGPRGPLYLEHPYQEWGAPEVTTFVTPASMPENFNWWNPSRALWDSSRDPNDPTKYYAITEFPFFSFWLGDMHPHVMALPFGLLALALALQTIARPAAPTFATGRRGWVELVLTGITLGSLYTINSWDFPTYLVLYLGALLLLYVRLGTRDWGLGIGDREKGPPIPSPQSLIASIWWRHFAAQALLALLAAGLFFMPFYLTFRSLVGGKEPLIDLPVLATLTRTIGFVTWTKTPLHSFVIIFGLALTPLLAYLIAQSRQAAQLAEALPALPEASDDVEETAAEPVGSTWREQRLGFAAQPLASASWRYLPLALLAVLLVGVVAGFPLLILLALALYAGRLALARAEWPADAFVLWSFALVCLICFGTELVYIRDVFESRMNTIFKFYYQAWLIWSVLAGYAVWWLFAGGTKDEGRRTKEGRADFWSSVIRHSSFVVFCVLFLALLAGALIYPWLTAGKTFRDDQRIGLDGKTPPEHTPEGAAAIAWLRANAPGDSVILEAVGDDYDGRGVGANAVSASTGLATVLGWAGHEQQWRGGDPPTYAQIEPRRADVSEIYSGTDTLKAAELLKKYKVDYIYAGVAEQATYAQIDPNKLAQLGEPVFQQGNVTIYRVR